MISESEFTLAADRTLEFLLEGVEAADEHGVIDVEPSDGSLALELPQGRHYLISRHAPSRQLWVSSPLSGGLHFSLTPGSTWALPDGTRLENLLASELEKLTGLSFAGLLTGCHLPGE